jgi:hypothetical protein
VFKLGIFHFFWDSVVKIIKNMVCFFYKTLILWEYVFWRMFLLSCVLGRVGSGSRRVGGEYFL